MYNSVIILSGGGTVVYWERLLILIREALGSIIAGCYTLSQVLFTSFVLLDLGNLERYNAGDNAINERPPPPPRKDFLTSDKDPLGIKTKAIIILYRRRFQALYQCLRKLFRRSNVFSFERGRGYLPYTPIATPARCMPIF